MFPLLGKGSILTALLIVSSWISAGFGQQQTVLVKRSGRSFVLTVTGAQTLGGVLDAFCREAGAACEGTANASSVQVSGSRYSGSWSEVIAQLMSGSHANYVAVEASSSQPARLIISREVQVKGPEPGESSVSEASPQVAAVSLPAAQLNSAPAQEVASSSTDSPVVESSGGSNAPDGPAAAELGTSGPGEESISPFSINGHGIPVTQESERGASPFSQNGQPIPPNDTEVPAGASPFVDNRGNPIQPTEPGQQNHPGPFPLTTKPH